MSIQSQAPIPQRRIVGHPSKAHNPPLRLGQFCDKHSRVEKSFGDPYRDGHHDGVTDFYIGMYIVEQVKSRNRGSHSPSAIAFGLTKPLSPSKFIMVRRRLEPRDSIIGPLLEV